jgi:hypothetical protein
MRERAQSVTVEGVHDGFEPPLAWGVERTPQGETRLVISVPPAQLPQVHQRLLAAMAPPLGVLYRQKVDRQQPRPEGAPAKDLLALELAPGRVLEALQACSDLVYGDARAELWLKGDLGEQLVLDQDGMVFAYPDDPSWREALAAAGVPEDEAQTLNERDYVKHWYHAENDAQEAEFVARLRLTEVRPQR